MGGERAGILTVVGGANSRHRLIFQLVVNVHKGKQAGVGKFLGGPVAADGFDVGFPVNRPWKPGSS